MSAVASLAPADHDRGEAGKRFDHVLAGVALAGQAAALARRMDRGFLSGAGWDPDGWVLTPPAGHRFLGRPRLRWRPGCMATSNGVCSGCRRRLTAAGLGPADVTRLPPLPAGGHGSDPVTGRAGWRDARGRGSRPSIRCAARILTISRRRGVDVAEFTALPGTAPLPSFGCARSPRVTGIFLAAIAAYCDTHQLRLWQARRHGADIDERLAGSQSPVIRAGRVVFTGLAPLLVIQVLFGLQQRAAQGMKTRDGVLRWMRDELRRQQVAALADARVPAGLGNDRRGTWNSLRTHARARPTDSKPRSARTTGI